MIKSLPKKHDGDPTTISLFVANLRLLELHRLADWPDIAVHVFEVKDTPQAHKRRLACVEWSIFRLLERWDPIITRDRLKPFFPPLEPLQSRNLRAALCRSLDELKKNGVLSRDVVLRKTTLDDCKGEKFEELLLSLSFIVLRKSIPENPNSHVLPVAQRLACKISLDSQETQSLRPLVIAHRAGITTKLRQRQNLNDHVAQLNAVLEQYQQQLDDRRQRLVRLQSSQRRISAASANSVRKALSSVSTNGDDLTGPARTLIEGDEARTRSIAGASQFDTFWDQVTPHIEPKGVAPPLPLLTQTLEQQQSRLKRLQQNRNAEETTLAHRRPIDKPRIASILQPVVDFSKHKDLHIGSSDFTIGMADDAQHITHSYQKVLGDMNYALASVSEGPRHDAVGSGTVQYRARVSEARRVDGDEQPLSHLRAGSVRANRPEDGRPEARVLDNSHSKETPALESEWSKASREGPDSVPVYDSETTARPPSSAPDDDHSIEVERLRTGQGASEPSPSILNPEPEGQIPKETVAFGGKETDDSDLTPPSSPLSRMVISGLDTKPGKGSVDLDLVQATKNSVLESLARAEQKSAADRDSPDRTRGPRFPVNQLETPQKLRKPSEATQTPLAEQRQRNVTPRAKLFSEEAEYASVFRSRPKVATSPVQSTPR